MVYLPEKLTPGEEGSQMLCYDFQKWHDDPECVVGVDYPYVSCTFHHTIAHVDLVADHITRKSSFLVPEPPEES